MSRSKQREGGNSPVTKYLRFKGGKGVLTYWDKNKGKDGAEVVIKKPLEFAVIDIKASVGGFNEKETCGVSSNLIDPMLGGEVEFKVKTKVGGKFQVAAEGLWNDIKGDCKKFGGKYTKNIFGVADFGSGEELFMLEVNGSGLRPWGEFEDENPNIEESDKTAIISRGILCTRKGGKTAPMSKKAYDKVLATLKEDPMADKPVMFYEPKFEVGELSDELLDLAIGFDERLQDYFGVTPVETEDAGATGVDGDPITSTATKPDTTEQEEDDLPF